MKQESLERNEFEHELDASFWNDHWKTGQTGWDMGQASPPVTNYLDQYENKHASILIPGCGNAYEAEYLVAKGFADITLVDIAEEAVARLKEKFKANPEVKVLCEDFFQHRGEYDLIIEQTFFCAQLLSRRPEYARKMASLLKKEGKLVGVLFGIQFPTEGPPFGGEKLEYTTLFEPFFQIKTMELCDNSIPPRAGAELFVNLVKK